MTNEARFIDVLGVHHYLVKRTFQIEGRKPSTSGERVQALVSFWQRIRILSGDGVDLAVIHAAPGRAVGLLHDHQILSKWAA